MEYTFELLEKESLKVIKAESGPYKNGFIIAKECEEISGIRIYNDVCQIYPHENEWYFQRWDTTPGPGEDDVQLKVKSIEQAIEYAYNSYFGKPIEIDGWVIPINKHPEWEIKEVKEVLSKIEVISKEKWEIVLKEVDEYYNKRKADKLPFCVVEYFRRRFISIENTVNNSYSLKLRRDLKIGYLVKI